MLGSAVLPKQDESQENYTSPLSNQKKTTGYKLNLCLYNLITEWREVTLHYITAN